MIVTIHQPDFMPWLGFFNKVNNADVLVVLDHTENNPRDSAFWGRRVKVLINGQENWFSIPLNKPQNGVIGIPIKEMTINLNLKKEIKKKVLSIKQNYSRHDYFDEIFPLVESYFNNKSDFLLDRNMEFILNVIKGLSINTKIVYSSNLSCHQKSTELLIEIIKKIDGDTYLCGGGASGYQHDHLFKSHDIMLKYNNFTSPKYEQMKSSNFVPGLSIIDPLMNLGFNGVKEIL